MSGNFICNYSVTKGREMHCETFAERLCTVLKPIHKKETHLNFLATIPIFCFVLVEVSHLVPHRGRCHGVRLFF